MSDLKLSFRCLLSVGVYKLCCGRKVEHDVGKSSKRKSTRLNPLQGGGWGEHLGFLGILKCLNNLIGKIDMR